MPSTVNGSLELLIPSNEFKTMTLDRFCVKKHFEIGLVNTLSTEDEQFLDRLVSLNKTKENITHVTFIDITEVETFIKAASSEAEDPLFPPNLLDDLKHFSEFNEMTYESDTETKNENEAYSIKFKLIHTMYEQFFEEVKEKKRREIVSRELTSLAAKKVLGSRDRKRDNEAKSKQSSVNRGRKSREKTHEVNSPEVEMKEDDLVIDDLLKNQIYFYILKGYNNIKLVKLLRNVQVKLSFIIQISEYEFNEYREFNSFWNEFETVRSHPFDYLQDIVLMKYQPPFHDKSNSSLESYLKDMVDVIKGVIDLKRLHYLYVKELMLFDAKFTEISTSFPIYRELLNRYPLETLSIPIIINGMLEEIHMKSNKIQSSTILLNSPTEASPKVIRTCPFNIKQQLQKSQEKKIEKNQPLFKVHEKDDINLTFKTYKLGYHYVKETLNVLKLQLPILLAEKCEFDDTLDDCLSHMHHVYVPSNKNLPIFNNEQIDYLINLLYLKNSTLRRKTRTVIDTSEFTKNLIVHDENKKVENYMPKCKFKKNWKVSQSFIDTNSNSNVYESIQPLSLHWAEIMKPELLFQQLLDSQLRFLCCDYIICELTNSLMVRFHNDVNSFGLHTKVWNEYLRTPVNLADFCKFTLTDDYEWLKKNKPYPQITYVEVVKMLEADTAVRLYADDTNDKYKLLLLPQIQYSLSDPRKYTDCPCIEEGVCDKIETKDGNKLVYYPELSSNLTDILNDLEEYKKYPYFSELCRRKPDQNYSFVCYNLGSTKFCITGHTTNFISLDNVSLTVDTSRLCIEKFNIKVTILSDDNLLVLNTQQEKFNFHVLLSDGTIIVFSKHPIEEKLEREDSDPLPSQDKGSITGAERNSILGSELSHHSFASKPEKDENMVTAMDFNHYSSLELYPIVGNMVRETPSQLLKTDLANEMDILKRLRNEPNILKVSQRGDLKYLEQIISETDIPISDVVRRIIKNPVKENVCRLPKRKCLVKGELPSKKINASFDYIITVPNGLTIRVQSSEIFPNSSAVKQAYEYAPCPDNISGEKYRLFSMDGCIVIRKVDGTMTILTSNGREIRFYKLSNTKGDEKYCKSQKKLDEDLVRKLLVRLMSNHPDQTNSDLYPSRRGHLHSKSKLVSKCPDLQEISKSPFSVISMITLEGYKITLKDEKLSKVLHSRHTSEIDFRTEERHYKRQDGFVSTTDRDGSHYVEFPDGTSIKTIVHVGEELVRVSAKDKMGWVLITATYLFEHASYKPVYFDNVNGVIEIRLNEFHSLNVKETGACLDMKNSILDIKTDVIDFAKICERCEGHYKCKLFVDPLYRNEAPEENACFVQAEDTYNKTFTADFEGNCKVVPTYIKGALNKNECNHSLLSDHQKIYSIKKDLSGMLLWSDKKASSIMRNNEEHKNVHHFTDVKKTAVYIAINKNINTKFNERFLGKTIREFEDSKKLLPLNRSIVYQVTRNLYSMFEMVQVDDLIKCLRNFFQEEVEQVLTESVSTLEFLQKHTDHSQSIFTHVSDEESKPTRTLIGLHERILRLAEKDAEVKRIMRTPIPTYFNSALCTFVPPERMSKKNQ